MSEESLGVFNCAAQAGGWWGQPERGRAEAAAQAEGEPPHRDQARGAQASRDPPPAVTVGIAWNK